MYQNTCHQVTFHPSYKKPGCNHNTPPRGTGGCWFSFYSLIVLRHLVKTYSNQRKRVFFLDFAHLYELKASISKQQFQQLFEFLHQQEIQTGSHLSHLCTSDSIASSYCLSSYPFLHLYLFLSSIPISPPVPLLETLLKALPQSAKLEGIFQLM